MARYDDTLEWGPVKKKCQYPFKFTGFKFCIVGCELTKDKPSLTWTFEEEDDDSDYLIHTLFLKHGVLGTSAVKSERNVVQIETKNFDKKEVKLPFLSLTLGQSDMVRILWPK